MPTTFYSAQFIPASFPPVSSSCKNSKLQSVPPRHGDGGAGTRIERKGAQSLLANRWTSFGGELELLGKRLPVEYKRWIGRAGIDVGYEFEDVLGALMLAPSPPEPILFARRMLNLKFAVLLMRSAYEAVDALDFIPMDKFQIKFWKLRQSEVEPYALQCQPLRVKYGDLTDPLYFDFISFSQFATISNEMRTGEVVFEEKMGSDGERRVVRRDTKLQDNGDLPAAFIDKAGKLLYQQLLDGFEGEVFDAPPPCTSDSDFSSVIKGVKKLLQVFVNEGYALNASIEPVQSSADNHGGKLRVKMEGSATQWGIQALASRRALLLSDFAALAVGGYLLASNRKASHKVRCSDTSTEQLWTIV